MVNKDYIILLLFTNIISVIPIISNANSRKRPADGKILGVPQQVRLDELKIHGIQLLGDESKTVLGILYRDISLRTHFKTYDLIQKKGVFQTIPGSLSFENLQDGTERIIVRDAQSVCLVAESALYLVGAGDHDREYPTSVPTIYNSHTKVSSSEWILGDDYGLLYSLTFDTKSEPLIKMISVSEDVPNTSQFSIPFVLVGLRTELFLGSHFGDSQLLRLTDYECIARKANLGPIQDMVVQSSLGSGSSPNIITVSGAYKDGSLSMIKYGIGMNDRAQIDMENIRGVWGVDELATIIIGFVDSYIVLSVSDSGDITQLASGDEVILYACAMGRQLILVTESGILTMNNGVIQVSQAIESITAAKSSDTFLYLLTSKGIQSWSLESESFIRKHTSTFEEEPSALDVAYDTVIVGFWNSSKIWLANLDFTETREETFPASNTAHSLVLQQFASMPQPSLLVSMVDGTLLTFEFDIDSRKLSRKKEVSLGTTQISLHPFKTPQGLNVFAVCQRPTIIHSSRSNLAFSSINLNSCNYFAAFNSDVLQSCMVVATDKGLRIGGIDDIQKLQINSVPLGELPRRLVKSKTVVAALTMSLEVEQLTGNETQRSYLKVFDPRSYELVDEFPLTEGEFCQSLCAIEVEGQECLVVGTSLATDEWEETPRGRIIVLPVTDMHVSTLSSITVEGSVYALAAVGDQLVAGIDSWVRLYNISRTALEEQARFRVSSYTVTLAVRDDIVLAGDLMKSVVCLRVADGKLIETARDYVPMWVTAVQFADAKNFICAEELGNLVLLAEPDSVLPENDGRLSRVGEFHYGEQINSLVSGTFITPAEDSIVTPHTLLGTVDGSIACIGTIATGHVDLLVNLQTQIGLARPTVGGLKHSEYRGYKSHGVRNFEPIRIVDGDLIEEFLHLTEEQQAKVCQPLDRPAGEIEKLVEDLSRLR